MLEPMISAPALPNTIDSKAPILIIALLIIVVSNYKFVSNGSFDASYGSFAMFINLFIIPSIGSTIKVSMSFEKKCIITINTIIINNVFPKENPEDI